MVDIAERAGTSVGALYVHFRSRDALVDAVIGTLQEEAIASLRATLASTDEPDVNKAIHRVAECYVTLLRDVRPYFALMATQSARTMTADVLRVGGAAAPLLQMINATIASLTASVEVRGDVALLAGGIASLWRGAALSYAVRPVTDERVIAASLADMTIAVLERVCPQILKLDARRLMRGMAQYLKTNSFVATV